MPEAPRDARHPASPLPSDDEERQFALRLQEIIQSLPRRSASAPTAMTVSPHEGVFGVATPAIEDQHANERRVVSAGHDAEGDSSSGATGRLDSLIGRGQESDAATRSDLGRSDHRDEVAAIAPNVPMPGVPEGDRVGTPATDRGHELAGVAVVDPASSGVSLGSSAETSTTGGAAGAFAAAIDPYAALRTEGPLPDRTPSDMTESDLAERTAALSETVATGPIGPGGRPEESFDRGMVQSTSATPWDASPGGDLSGGYPAASSAGEAPGGVDLNQTNALLGQILDELRRNQQQAPIASGRSVYPER